MILERKETNETSPIITSVFCPKKAISEPGNRKGNPKQSLKEREMKVWAAESAGVAGQSTEEEEVMQTKGSRNLHRDPFECFAIQQCLQRVKLHETVQRIID